jgi:hypothetical protein
VPLALLAGWAIRPSLVRRPVGLRMPGRLCVTCRIGSRHRGLVRPTSPPVALGPVAALLAVVTARAAPLLETPLPPQQDRLRFIGGLGWRGTLG